MRKLDSNSLFTSYVVMGKSHPNFVSDPCIAYFQLLSGAHCILGLFHPITHGLATFSDS